MTKQSRTSKKKRKEPHMIVRELPDGLREVTVDGHTWIEGPYTAGQRESPDDHGATADDAHPLAPPDGNLAR